MMKIKILIFALLSLTLTTSISALPTKPCTGLTWEAPITNMDGSTLTDLVGYQVYWSAISGVYTDDSRYQTVDRSVLFTDISGLGDPDGLYFVVTAYDTLGNESNFSNEMQVSMVGISAPGGLSCSTE